jgi:hypothetical protein
LQRRRLQTAPHAGELERRFRVTHPFHPPRSQEFTFVVQRNSWGREWLDFHDATGRLSAIPTDWTDRAEPDPFVVIAASRCHLRFEDLLRLVDMVEQACKGKDAAHVNRTMPLTS